MIPGQAPRLHPTQQRARRHAARLELLGRDQTGLAGPADRDDRGIARQRHRCQRMGVAGLQCVVGIDVDAPGNRPLRALLGGPHVEERYRSPLLQPLPHGLHIDGKVTGRHHRSLL